MGKWENGKWENGKMGKWENGKMGNGDVIRVSSECHPNVIQMPSECHPNVIRMASEWHPNGRVPQVRACARWKIVRIVKNYFSHMDPDL